MAALRARCTRIFPRAIHRASPARPRARLRPLPPYAQNAVSLPQVSASRSTAASLPGATLAPPNGSVAAAALPADVLAGQTDTLADGVDAVLYSLPQINLYADPTAQAGAATTGFGTQLVSLQLASATDGSALAINNLATPIVLALPRATSGGERCARDADCSGSRRGTCTSGVCVCKSPYAGDRCAALSVCSYWDVGTSLWKTDGCVALEPVVEHVYSSALRSTGIKDGSTVVLCSCDHLTTFAGLVEPDATVHAPPSPSPPRQPSTLSGAQPAAQASASSASRAQLPIAAAATPSALIIGLSVGGALVCCCVVAAMLHLGRRCSSPQAKPATSTRRVSQGQGPPTV